MTKFKKGTSGNPKGRPKKELSLTNALREELKKDHFVMVNGKKEKKKNIDIVINKIFNSIRRGDKWAIDLLFNRLEGKPLQAIESKIEGDLNVASDERASEAKACIAIIEQRLADSDKCSS